MRIFSFKRTEPLHFRLTARLLRRVIILSENTRECARTKIVRATRSSGQRFSAFSIFFLYRLNLSCGYFLECELPGASPTRPAKHDECNVTSMIHTTITRTTEFDGAGIMRLISSGLQIFLQRKL